MRFRRRILQAFIAVSAGLMIGTAAHAATLNVPSDYGTIQLAIDAAADGDTIVIAPGTFQESLYWGGRSLILKGAGAGQTVVDPSWWNGGPGGGCMFVENVPAGASVDGITFRFGEGSPGGGVNNYFSTVKYTNCSFENNVGYYGGGMLNYVSATTVSNCSFSGNYAYYSAGGMFNYYSDTVTSDTTFGGNTATWGGAIYNQQCSPEFQSCRFEANTAYNYGGAVYHWGQSGRYIDSEFVSNNAWNYAGGAVINDGTNASYSGCKFDSNSSVYSGAMHNVWSSPSITSSSFSGNSAWEAGGIGNFDSNTSLTDTTLSGNYADYGGGLYAANSNVVLRNCTVTGNSAWEGGGVSISWNCTGEVTDCTVENNYASNAGGGLILWASSTTVTGCEVRNNWATYGGGVLNYSGNRTIANSIFQGNGAYYGGGIYNYFSPATVINCTSTRNWAYYEGGGIYNQGSYPTVANCILFGDSGGEISGWYGADVSHSTVQGGYPGFGNSDAAPVFVNADAGDLRLKGQSPCINSGANAAVPAGVTTDIDGGPRIVGGIVDKGAFEADAPELIQILKSDVSALAAGGAILPAGGNALEVKLDAALAALLSGNTHAAEGAIQAFINQVNALVKAGRLNDEQAQPLIAAADTILTLI